VYPLIKSLACQIVVLVFPLFNLCIPRVILSVVVVVQPISLHFVFLQEIYGFIVSTLVLYVEIAIPVLLVVLTSDPPEFLVLTDPYPPQHLLLVVHLPAAESDRVVDSIHFEQLLELVQRVAFVEYGPQICLLHLLV